MGIDNKGKGKERQKVTEEESINITSMSTPLQTIHLINIYIPISDEPNIKLGATYDLSLLPDHHGDYFQHPKAHFIQQDYQDVDKNLIAPWKTYEALTTGTIVLIDAVMNCWKMKITEKSYCKVSI